MDRIERLVREKGDDSVLSSIEHFCRRAANVKTNVDLQNLFRCQRKYTRKKIKVQPTSAIRRKSAYRGSYSCRAGQPRKDSKNH